MSAPEAIERCVRQIAETLRGAMRDQQRDSPTTGELWTTRSRDVFTAIRTRRFFATAHDVGTRSEYRTFGYLVENTDDNRSHRVIPLYELRRKVQHGMEVKDNEGKELVNVPSQSGALLAREHFAGSLAAVNERLTALGIAELEVRDDSVGALFAPPLVTTESRTSHTEAATVIESALYIALCSVILRAISERVRLGWRPRDGLSQDLHLIPTLDEDLWFPALASIDDSFVEVSAALLSDLDSAEIEAGIPSIVDLASEIRRIIRFAVAHRDDFIPLAILNRPLPPGIGGDSPLTFLTHTVRGWGSREKPGELREFWRSIVSALTAHYSMKVEFPVNPETSSSHFRINLASGLRFKTGKPPQPVDTELQEAFRRHSQGGASPGNPWEALDDTSFTFYRTSGALAEYMKLQGDEDATLPNNEGAATSGSETVDPPSFEIEVRARERSTTIILSVLLLLASATCSWLVLSGNPLGSAMATATIAISIALAIFCAERPAIRLPIILRITVAVGAVILATVLKAALFSAAPTVEEPTVVYILQALP